MRVLWVLVAWGVLAVLATMCFALGGSIGYRRGVRDTLAQIRDRRTGKTGCRPLPANHLRRRTSGHARPGARARRARWHVGPGSVRTPHARRYAIRMGRVPTVAAASVAVLLLIGIPGTAIGATTAQPGESLWKVKLGLERVRLALATTPERDTEVHVDLARVRLTELEGLVTSDPAPAVVGDVSKDLGDHALAASGGLRHVDPAARPELQERILDVTAEQVAVMDELLENDCALDPDLDCDALEETRDDMLALQFDTDVAIADAESTDVATAAASSPPVQAEPLPSGPADADAPPASEATTGDATASGDDPADAQPAPAPAPAASSTPSVSPSVSASAAPASTPSAKPSPTASPTPPPAGSPATETAVEPAVDETAGGVSPKVDAGAAAADGTSD